MKRTHIGARISRAAAMGTAAWLGSMAAAASAGLYDSWGYEAEIRFSGYNRPETLTNFPVLVVLSNNCFAGFSHSQFASDRGGDLRFSDEHGTTGLAYEIESWNPNGASYLWVQVPALARDTAIEAWWGAAGQAPPPCTTNGSTWANGYVGVWHMGQTNALDSTANACNGSAQGGVTLTTGVAGDACKFNGSSGCILVPDKACLNFTGPGLTLEAWVKPASLPGGEAALVRKERQWATQFNGPNTIRNLVDTTGVTGWTADHDVAYPFLAATWYYFSLLWDGANLMTLLDAGKRGSATCTGNIKSSGNAVTIGKWNSHINGAIDEIRISKVARSSDWIWACYQNMASNAAFQTCGAIVPGRGLPGMVNQAVSNVTATSAWLNGALVSTGTSDTAVSVYWGASDGGTNAAGWAGVNTWEAPQDPGDFSFLAAGLASAADHYYTYAAANAGGAVWAAPSQYFITGEVTLEATDDSLGSNLADSATVEVLRPATCTNGALTIYYATGGDVTNGVQYVAVPAGGELVIPAGATRATITLVPRTFNPGAPLNLTLTLAPGPYVIGAAGSVTCTVASVPPAIYTWDGSTADWTLPEHWLGDLPGLLPANGSTGIVAGGTARITQSAGDLYDAAAGQSPPAEIVIRAGGTVEYHRLDGVSIANHNFVLDGGTFAGVGRLYNNGSAYDHGLAVRNPSLIDTRYEWSPGPWTLRGPVRDYDAEHTGRLTLRLPGGRDGGLVLAARDAPFRGGWLLEGVGNLQVRAPGAAGSGDIVATNGAIVVWYGGDDAALPGVTINDGCSFLLGADGRYNTLPGKAIVLRDGATFGTWWLEDWHYNMRLEAPLHVTGDITLRRGSRRTALYLDGDIINDGPAVIDVRDYSEGDEHTYISRENSSYAGDWIVSDAKAILQVAANGALGTGRVELRAGTSLPVTRDLELRNMIGGEGTLGSAGRTVTLRPCRRDGVSTPAGIAPGAGWGAAVGTLSVAGDLAFASLEDGGDVVRCKLLIDVAGPAEAVTNDLLAVAGDLAGLEAVDLHVTLSGVAAAALGGRPLVFLRAANAQDPAAFHSVVPPPGASVAVTAEGLPAGSLGLLIRSAGTLMLLR
jgi:hypothetical protein